MRGRSGYFAHLPPWALRSATRFLVPSFLEHPISLGEWDGRFTAPLLDHSPEGCVHLQRYVLPIMPLDPDEDYGRTPVPRHDHSLSLCNVHALANIFL